MAFNAYESIAASFSNTRKKLEPYSSSPEGVAPAAPPAPVAPTPVPTYAPPMAPPTPAVAQPTRLPDEVIAALGAIQSRGERYGIDTTTFDPEPGQDLAGFIVEMNDLFDQKDAAQPLAPKDLAGHRGDIEDRLGSGISDIGRYFQENPNGLKIRRLLGSIGPNYAAAVPGVEPILPETFVKGEGFERGLREGIRNFSHPQELLITAETAGVTKALSLTLKALAANKGWLTNKGLRLAANIVEPVSGGYSRRLAFEGGAGLGANIGGSVVQETLPEDVQGFPRIAATLAGTLATGAGLGIGGVKAIDSLPSARTLERISPIGVADAAFDGVDADDALEKARQNLSDIMDRNIKAENSRDPDVRANAFGGPEARINAEVEAGEMIGKITRGEIELGTTPTTSSLTIEGGTPEINARLQSDIADTTANANAKKAQIDEIDRAFKDGELTPQETMERLQAVNDPNIDPSAARGAGGQKQLDEANLELQKAQDELREAGEARRSWGTRENPAEKVPEGATRAEYRVIQQRNIDQIDRLDKAHADATARREAAMDRVFEAEDLVKADAATPATGTTAARGAGDPSPGTFAEPEYPDQIGNTVKNAGSLRFHEIVYRGDDPQPWAVDRINGNLVDIDRVSENPGGGFRGLQAGTTHDFTRDGELIRSGFDLSYELPIPPRGTYVRESLDIPTPQQQVDAATSAVNADADTKLAQIRALSDEAKNSSMSPQEHQRRLQEINDGVAAPVAPVDDVSPIKLSKRQRELVEDDLQGVKMDYDDFLHHGNSGDKVSPEARAFLSRHLSADGALRINGELNAADQAFVAKIANNIEDKFQSVLDEDVSLVRPKKDWVSHNVANTGIKTVRNLKKKLAVAPVARVADDIPTSGQATLDGGVVAARTEQDIVDARTVQSGFDLTATGEDAPLRQVDAAASGAGDQRGFKVTDEASKASSDGSKRFTVSNEGSTAQAMVLQPDENGKVIGSIVDFETSPELRRQGFGEALVRDTTEELRRRGATSFEVYAEKASRSPELFDKLGFKETGRTTRHAREMVLDLTRAADDPPTPATGTTAAPPASTDEVVINGKKYVEAPETPVEPVATTSVLKESGIPETPDAPVEPAPKNPIPADQVEKYDVQNGFDEFGQLSTYESTVAKPYGDLDSDLAQAEWDIKDADFPISDADYYAENELFEFDVNERLSEFPTYERNLDPDNPVHAAQIEVNRLEQRIDDSLGRVDDGVTGKKKTEEIKSDDQLLEDSRFPDPEQIAYQRELELETMATGRLQPWTKRLLGSQDGFPDGGLTPRQAFILIGELESQLPSMSGTTRIYKKDGKLTGGVAQPKAVDYQAWAKKKWGRPNLDASQSKAPYGPPREYYTAPKTSKEYKAARNPKNWKVDTTAIDELSSDITTIHPTYDPEIVGSEVALSNFMRDVEAAKSARVEYNQIVADRKYGEDVATAGTREAKTEADKLAAEAARRQLLIANEKLIEAEDHIVMNYAGQRINTETGEILTKAPVSVNKALEGETVYVNARGEEISTEEYLASDVLDAGAVKANDINRQNPYSGTMSEGGQGVNPRSVEPVVGLYTAEEVALLPENLTARLVAQNINTQNPVRGTSGSIYAKGVNPNAVDPVVGKGNPVEQGLEYPVAGTGRATQSSMAGTRNDTAREFHTDPVSKKLIDDFLAKSKAAEELRNRSKEIKPIVGTGDPLNPARGLDQNVGRGAVQTTQDVDERIRTSRMLPAKISSEEEAIKAYNGAFMMPNTDSKLQVGLAGMTEVFLSHGTRKMAEDVLVYNMPGEEIIPPKEFLAAVAEHKLDDIGQRSAWRLNPGTAANTVDRGQSIGPMTNSVIETTQRASDTKGRWLAVALDDWAKIPSRYGLSETGTSVFKKALRSATRGIPKVEIIPKAERIKQKNILGYNSKPLWQFGNRSTAEPDDMTRLTKIMETLSGDADLDMDALKLVETRPTVAKNVEGLTPVKQRAFIEAAKEGRILLDNIRIFQNRVRAARGQDPIAWRPDYMPNIRESNLWRALGQYTEDPAVIARQTPDFTKAGEEVFNARAMNLKHKMGENIRDMNADRLIRGYIQTASADVFDTEIVRNIKAHTKLMRKETTDEYSLENAARFFDDYADQVYLKRPTRFTEWARGNALNARLPMGGDRQSMSLVDSALLLKKIVTVSTFPLNWTWNSFVQTSSGLLTPVRYGVRNSIKALDSFFDQEVKDQIALHAYTFRVKSQKGSSVVMQNTGEDAVFAFKPTKREQVIEFASFISNQIEKFLTRHAVRAAYLRGEQMGYKGAELWQYASQGGARTQSMYNKADTVASLRSREMSAIVPFQTFAFEMLNTLSEMNVPGLRNVIGKSGAYESFSANTAGGSATSYRRMKNIGLLVAGMVAWNVVADRTSNRKPWNLSSFLPFFAVMKQGVDGFGPGGAFLPAKFGYDVVQGFNKYYRSGDFSYLRTLLMRYTVVPGGTTVDKWLLLIDGLEDEAVRNPDRTIRFKVEKPEMTGIEFDVPFIGKKTLTDKKINPEEFLRVYGSGTWASNGGREELSELGYRNNQEGQSVVGKASSTLSNIVGLQNFPTIGKFNTNSLDRKYKKDLEFYYSIPSDPEEAAAAELPSRSYLRKNDPQLEAHLFIIGRVTALTKGTGALLITRELVIEYDLLSQGGGWFNGRKITPKEELRYRKVLGEDWVNSVIGGSTDTGSSSPLDSGGGIAPLEFGSPDRSSGAEPQSSAPQTANEQWRLASTYLTRDNLVALQKIWDGEPVSRPESASLKAVFEKVPLGQTNFRKWSKQTLRQVHENATVQMPREAVTV